MFDPETISPDYNQLISAIYQGPLETIPWQGFLPLLCQQMKAMAVSLALRPPANDDAGLLLNYRRPEPGSAPTFDLADPSDWPASAYREYFFALDPFVNLPDGKVVTLAELLPAEKMAASEYYSQYLKPAGVFHIIGADTREPGGSVANLRVCRGQPEAEFDQRDRQLINMLMPHLKRAIQLHTHIKHTESERDLYSNAVDKLAVGTVILDQRGRLLTTNTLASLLLAEKDGITQSNNQIQIANRDQHSEFQRLVTSILPRQASTGPAMAEAMRVSRPSGRADLGLVIKPVPVSEWSEGHSSPSVAVFISDPEQHSPASQQVITRLFGFTPAEALLAMLLAKGLSLAEASTQQGISQHTARAQLKSIFAKTAVNRQAELVRLIIKSVANLG